MFTYEVSTVPVQHLVILDDFPINAIKTSGLYGHAEQTHSRQNKYWIHTLTVRDTGGS